MELYVTPRGNGKTYSLISRFLEDPENTQIWVSDVRQKDFIIREIIARTPTSNVAITKGLLNKQILTASQVYEHALPGRSRQKVYIDNLEHFLDAQFGSHVDIEGVTVNADQWEVGILRDDMTSDYIGTHPRNNPFRTVGDRFQLRTWEENDGNA